MRARRGNRVLALRSCYMWIWPPRAQGSHRGPTVPSRQGEEEGKGGQMTSCRLFGHAPSRFVASGESPSTEESYYVRRPLSDLQNHCAIHKDAVPCAAASKRVGSDHLRGGLLKSGRNYQGWVYEGRNYSRETITPYLVSALNGEAGANWGLRLCSGRVTDLDFG